MDILWTSTTSSKLSELNIVNGQLIYLTDINAAYYDVGSRRRLVSNLQIVNALPSTSAAQEGAIYGMISGTGHLDTWVWDATSSTYKQMTGYLATASSAGLVKPDGTTITVDTNGVISALQQELSADNVTYDNSISGLSSTSVQEAIDEVNTLVNNAASAAASASTTAAAASQTASQAASAAANASTLAQSAFEIASSASTVVQGFESRIQALEAIAAKAILAEDNNT